MSVQAQAIATLNAAVDRLDEAQFAGIPLPRQHEDRLAAFIAARQGGAGAYANSFALTAAERAAGIRVFTGEHMTSASARHIIGEESCRALRNVTGRNPSATKALKAAAASMEARILPAVDTSNRPGVFCCGKCTVAFWRNLAAGGFNAQKHRLADGMRFLHDRRDGKGGWTRFPFYYTLLALTEIGPSLARPELKYAAPILRKRLARKPGAGIYARRRHEVMTRALGMV